MIRSLPTAALRALPSPFAVTGHAAPEIGPALTELATCWALRAPAFFAPARCAALVRGVYDARPDWVPSFDASQFSLGRAFYTDLEEDRAEAYFAEARASDQRVRRHVPGLQESLLFVLSQLLAAPVRQRPGFCGPGVHIFPAGKWVARSGGEVHFDLEGLSDAARAARAPALTLVLVLQAAARGGGLRVWGRRFAGVDHPARAPAPAGVPGATVPYAAGDLIVIDSYRLHQIEPFTGALDRITATVHAVRGADGWEAWF